MQRALIAMLVAACNAKSGSATESQPAEPPTRAPVVARAVTDYPVRADRRIELFAIIGRLASVPGFQLRDETAYSKAVDAAFSPFARHPAIVATRALVADHHADEMLLLVLAGYVDSSLEPSGDPSVQLAPLGKVDYAAYFSLVRDFAKTAKVDAFLDAHRADYAALEQRIRQTCPAPDDLVGWLDRSFGPPPSAYSIVPSGLVARWASVSALPATGPVQETVLGASLIIPEMCDALSELLVRAYTDDLVGDHARELTPAASKLYASVKQQLRLPHEDSSPLMMIAVSLREALFVLHLRDAKLDDVATSRLRQRVGTGMLWLPELVALLDREHRSPHPLAASLPVLVTFFDELATRYARGVPRPPFPGSLGAAFASDMMNLGPPEGVTGFDKISRAVGAWRTPVRLAELTTIHDWHEWESWSELRLGLYGSPATNPGSPLSSRRRAGRSNPARSRSEASASPATTWCSSRAGRDRHGRTRACMS